MSRRGRTAATALITCVTVGGLAGCASTAAQKSFAQIRVIGFTRTGVFDDTWPGTSDTSGVYVGRPVDNADLINVVTGPGVTVTIFRKPSPHVAILPTDNTVYIGRGDAPLGCGLLIYQYRPGKSPDDRWNVSDSQLAHARVGEVRILEITVVCGKGPARYTGGVRNPIGWNGKLYPLGPPGSGMAEKTTVASAQAAVGYPVPVPSTAAASRANLTQAWVNGNTIPREQRAVALVFDNGKVQITMRRAAYQSALHYFQAFVAEKDLNRVTAAIGQVNGRPALVVTPNTSAFNHSNPAVVNFWRNGALISIYSNTYGTGTLLAIASSMQ